MFKRIFFLFLLLFPFVGLVQYQWDTKSETFLSNQGIQYLIDEEEKYVVDSLPDELFKTFPNNTANFGFAVGTIWTKIKVRSRRKERIIFEIKNPSIDMVYLYKIVDDKPILLGKKGDLFIPKGGTYLTRYTQFEIEVPCELVAKIVSRGSETSFPIFFHTKAQLQRRDFIEQLLLGFYFGIISFVIIISVFIILFTNNKIAWYFFGFLFFLMLLQLNLFGFGYKYIWPGFIEFNNHSVSIFAYTGLTFLLLFTSKMLNTKKHTNKIHKSIYIFISIIVVLLFFSLIPNPFVVQVSNVISSSFAIIIPGYCVFIGVIILRRQQSEDYIAEIITLGISLFFLFTVVQILRIYGVVENNFFTEYSLIFGALLEITCMTIAVFKIYNLMQNKVLESFENLNAANIEHNEQLEIRIAERTLELNEKSSLIERSKKELTDSIFYAKFIQNGLLPTEDSFIKGFRDGFVLFKPKDIVSGDFYWRKTIAQKRDGVDIKKITICLGDCTGHGVPGAILSVLGLREINSFRPAVLSNPSLTLQSLKKQFQDLFKNETEGVTIRDGMDASICCFDLNNKEVTFSGARQDLYLVRNNEMIVYKGNRMSIDGVLSASIPFTQEKIQLKKGDCIYLCSDGFPDQFGGELGKKLKTRVLREMLVKYHNLPMQKQKEILIREFKQWKGKNEQTDDVSIIGLRI